MCVHTCAVGMEMHLSDGSHTRPRFIMPIGTDWLLAEKPMNSALNRHWGVRRYVEDLGPRGTFVRFSQKSELKSRLTLGGGEGSPWGHCDNLHPSFAGEGPEARRWSSAL